MEIPISIQTKVKTAIAGDVTAFGSVFEYFRPRLLAHAYRICGNSPIAQDAVQDTFIASFTHLDRLREAEYFYPWLKKILVNNCYLLLRRERSVELQPSQIKGDQLVMQSVQVNIEKLADRWQLFDALKDLSEELRSVLILRYFTAYKSYEDIATLLGIPLGTVRSRLAAAKSKLTATFQTKTDSNNQALQEAENWSGYYLELYRNFYDDLAVRNELLDHHDPHLNLRYTSGQSGKGRGLLECELNNDLVFGSRFEPEEVTSSGNISVIEGYNINHPNYPDRCAPRTVMVLFRKQQRIGTVHIFDSQRPLKA
jgi:RNA polymerase sigma factor (sigma-70 family)